MIQIDLLRQYIDEPESAEPLLASLHLRQGIAGHTNLRRIAESGVTLDLLASLCDQFHHIAPQLADADMAWNNLERFIRSTRNPMATAALFERDRDALPNLLQLLSTSQYLSDLLVVDNECYDLLRATEGLPVARDMLVDELAAEVLTLQSPVDASAALRSFKRREVLRIAYGDIVRGQPVATVARQISYVAEAVIEAAYRFVRRDLEDKIGVPTTRNGRARFVVLALGKLGGCELNYSSDIDLVLLYDADGQTDGRRPTSNHEFFARLSRDLVRMLTEPTSWGTAYRVDLRLRPEGSRGAVCLSKDQALTYYDIKGRTWERQAFIKARAVAGDASLGAEILQRLEPWIYRRYLSLADITGIRSLKRRIERHTRTAGAGDRNVKTGHGGIRDIEFAIQFLQLLNGGTLSDVRTGNTFEAIARLADAGCLTHQERTLLRDNYNALRKLEHRLQIMFDLQTHVLPEGNDELQKLAMRLGYQDSDRVTAREQFETEHRERTEVNRRILDHLLHDAFGDDATAEPEVDLVNDPDPGVERIEAVLGRYPFSDVPAAYNNLMALADEKIRFLSTRRCRHFLASIAPRLLSAIAATPEPDSTLVNLSRVSDSLGGKASLWELFSSNRATLNLYVTLCAACPYLAEILTSNPGMIDELMDSLVVDGLPSRGGLQSTLAELTRGAEDIEPMLHSFKNAQHLRVGVRDILGKDDVQQTHAALADVAEVCLLEIVEREYEIMVAKFGQPFVGPLPDDEDAIDATIAAELAPRVGQPCHFVIVALGKLGGREPNYHSDLDLVFLFEADGQTRHNGRSRGATTNNAHFFSELAQRIIKVASHIGPFGRLYEIDSRLRPTGRSGTLALPITAFYDYFASGRAQLWERQSLCKARIVFGESAAKQLVASTIDRVAYGPKWTAGDAQVIREMRTRLEKTATPRNLKRGRGGTVDTEFLVQMLQLKHGGDDPAVRVPGTLDALKALEEAGYLEANDAAFLRESYRFQRSVEARIRLMNAAGRHELPTDDRELARLAFLLGYSDAARLESEAQAMFDRTRGVFERYFAREEAAV